MTTWKALCRYSRHSNGSELVEQVIHTYRISYRNDWPRRFGELNPSPHSWIFNSVSVDSSPLSYLFTSATVPIPVPTAPEIWHLQVFKSQFPHPWISRTVISVTKRSCAAAFSSSFYFYYFTPATVPIPVHTAPKCGTEHIRYVTLHYRERRGAASLRYSNHRSYV